MLTARSPRDPTGRYAPQISRVGTASSPGCELWMSSDVLPEQISVLDFLVSLSSEVTPIVHPVVEHTDDEDT